MAHAIDGLSVRDLRSSTLSLTSQKRRSQRTFSCIYHILKIVHSLCNPQVENRYRLKSNQSACSYIASNEMICICSGPSIISLKKLPIFDAALKDDSLHHDSMDAAALLLPNCLLKKKGPAGPAMGLGWAYMSCTLPSSTKIRCRKVSPHPRQSFVHAVLDHGSDGADSFIQGMLHISLFALCEALQQLHRSNQQLVAAVTGPRFGLASGKSLLL